MQRGVTSETGFQVKRKLLGGGEAAVATARTGATASAVNVLLIEWPVAMPANHAQAAGMIGLEVIRRLEENASLPTRSPMTLGPAKRGRCRPLRRCQRALYHAVPGMADSSRSRSWPASTPVPSRVARVGRVLGACEFQVLPYFDPRRQLRRHRCHQLIIEKGPRARQRILRL
jgi:hypothetical protein